MAPPRKRNLDARAAELPGASAVSSGPASTKKVKFGAEDPVDDEELEFPSGSKNRRNAVQTEGYDSDSSQEDVGGDAGPAAAAGDDEDMFATTAPEPPKGPEPSTGPRDGLLTKASGKGKAFLDLEDIEGQEVGRATGERSDTDSDEEEDFEEGDEHANDDDAPRSRRNKKGMGYVISGFNMKEEMKEGKLTADGDYLANEADPLAMHDNWLNGVSSKKDLKAARQAKARYDARIAEQERQDSQALSRVDAMKAIADSALVRRHESVLAALARHGRAKKQGDTDAQRKITELTNLASTLLDVHGEADIYEQTNDDLIRELRLEGEVPRGWEPAVQDSAGKEDGMDVDAAPAKKRNGGLIARPAAASAPAVVPPAESGPDDPPRFFYRWSATSGAPPNQRSQIHGPYTRKQMSDWIGGGFFGMNAERIEVRVDGQRPDDWRAWSAV